MRIVNPKTGNVLGIEYIRYDECLRDAQSLASDLCQDLEIHSENGIELVETDYDQ